MVVWATSRNLSDLSVRPRRVHRRVLGLFDTSASTLRWEVPKIRVTLYYESNWEFDKFDPAIAERNRQITERHKNGDWGIWCSIRRPERPLFGRYLYEVVVEVFADETALVYAGELHDLSDDVESAAANWKADGTRLIMVEERDGECNQAIVLDLSSVISFKRSK